jgi:oxygen-independent coproporphyrinogen-3 oxidase
MDLSLYIHVPFCKRRCAYCTFYHVPFVERYENEFVDALIAEFRQSIAQRGDVRLPTVFFGGGTPSVLSVASLGRIFDAIAPHATTDCEITMEANPEDVTPALLRAVKGLGVNRLSLGVQSMSDRALRVLKRCSAATNRSAVEAVRNTFDNFSFDLVLGTPDGSVDEVGMTLETLSDAAAPHYSVYCLEPGGVMEKDVEGFFANVDSESAAPEYLHVCEVFGERGYHHYEVSNFARPGRESRHNRVYWRGGDFLGIGPAAHSYLNGDRHHNEASIEAYVTSAGRPARQLDPRDAEARRLEHLMLSLRTSDGLPLDDAPCGSAGVAELVEAGLARALDGRLILTDGGYLLLSEIVLRVSEPA